MKMIKITLCTVLCFFSLAVYSQGVAINTDGSNADGSAMLDVKSTNSGMLIPRMTQVQRNALTLPAESLIIFQTDNTPGYYYNSGTAVTPVWERIATGSDLGFVDGSGDATRVAFWSDPNTLSSNANLYWDNTNGRLGVGNSVPSQAIDVTGNANVSANLMIASTTTITSGRIGRFANGTALLPAYSFTADSDIGMWRPAVNVLAFSTAGIERMRLDAVGNIGIGASPVATAILDLNSTSKGMLVPRMSEAQKNAIVSPATGLLIYQTDLTAGFYYFDGTTWNWLFSGTVPSVPGNVEHWIRPAAANYIHPEHNSNIRVHDAAETYGIFYDGSSNQYGIFSQTSSATSPTSAVVGFSNVSGNSTYGYLGFNGTYTAPTAGFGSVYGSGVYGIVDDPGRTAGFFRSTGSADYAANIAYSDVWIPGFFYGDHIDDAYAGRPAIYASMNTHVDVGGSQSAVQGRSEYLGGTTSNLGFTIGGQFSAIGNEQDAYGIYTSASTSGSAISTGAYIEGDQFGTDSWKLDDLMQGTGYAYNTSFYGSRGVATASAPSDANYYNYGVYGLFGDLGAGWARRSGGVLGYLISSTDAWGSLGYLRSNNTVAGVYGSTVYASGAGKSTTVYSGTGVAGYGDLFGAWFRGDVYGTAFKGERFSLYVDGKQYNNDLIVFMNDDESSDEKIPTYASSSMSADVYAKGVAIVENNFVEVKFDTNYSKLIDENSPVIITITPVGKNADLYIEKISAEGFVVVNESGNQNVTFNWIAIGTRKDFPDHDNPTEICSDNFDFMLEKFMFNENDKSSQAQPLWWDGSVLRYDDNTQSKNLINLQTNRNLKNKISDLRIKNAGQGNSTQQF